MVDPQEFELSELHCIQLLQYVIIGRIECVRLYGRVEQCRANEQFNKHDKFLHGLNSYKTKLQTDVSIDNVPGVTWTQKSETEQSISFHHFPPGTVLIIRY